MVAFRSSAFGGMIPSVDDTLLPDNNASRAENTWLLSGTLQPMHNRRVLRALTNTAAKRAYRIPLATFNKDNLDDAIWMEFADIDTDVVKSALTGDSYERYYAASPTVEPSYNTKARIQNGDPWLKLGISAPTSAPTVTAAAQSAGTVTISTASPAVVTKAGHGLIAGRRVRFTTTRALPYPLQPGRDYYVSAAGLTTDTFQISETAGGTSIITTAPTVTISNASPGVVTRAGHNLLADDTVEFATTGALPTGLSVTTQYYVKTVIDNDTFTVSATRGGAAVATSSAGSGTHTLVGGGTHSVSPQITGVTRAYVYTWVTAYGEEGPPSPADIETGANDVTWGVSIPAIPGAVSTGRNITHINIYRTITSSTGVATFFFVAQVAIGTASYNDILTDASVATAVQLPSTNWSAPPPDLKGIIEMPNGIIAGFRTNEVWFCEPYRYHAWPAAYALGVPSNIVGLGVVGQTLVVCTTGKPYTITGVTPASMAMSVLPQIEPCLSRGSIVSSPSGVFYASQNGIVNVQPGSATNITTKLLNKDDWLDIAYIPSLRGVMLNNAYYAWGSALNGVFEPTAFETSGFEQTSFDGSDGQYFGMMVNLNDQRLGYTVLVSSQPIDNVWSDIWTGEVLMISGQQIEWMDISGTQGHGTYKWRSKKFQLNYLSNMGAMRLHFRTYSDTPTLNPTPVVGLSQQLQADQYALVRAYCDGRHVWTRELRTSNEIMRLPAGFKGLVWEFEIEGRVEITKYEFANTVRELQGV
jgi:hypothetical protein